ncbi:MAG: serine/threonine-protein kinase, partial [Planctomycetia bacterium]
YMAPEQAMPSLFGPMGPPTDVYGLGSVLYALLTGRAPYAHYPADQLLSALVQKNITPIPPSKLNSKIPAALENVCLRALRKNPAERYKNGWEFRDALSAC